MKWYDYEIVSPKENGNYMIFISGDIHTGEFDKIFGFISIENGCAFQQNLITHWSELPEPPQ